MISVGLVHWPCVDKNGSEIATAVTNLDLHDCARVCLTYGINTLYILHPNRSQREFARRIMDHWLTGFGGQYNPLRKRALETVRLVAGIEEIRLQGSPLMVGTSARKVRGCITWDHAADMARTRDVCLLFGTGWGLSPGMLEQLDAVIEPIAGEGDFNHLSVRSAVAITVDRIARRKQ